VETISALGYCRTCNRPMIRVGETNKCIRCESNKNVASGPTVDVKDPGDAAVQQSLKNGGLAHAEVIVKQQSFGTAEDALKIMRNLPIPEDIKQFKQIKKIISLIEKLTIKE
jgi:hypothetical protein